MQARKSGRQRQPAVVRGQCIVLIGPEGRGKEVLIATARRRFSADASFDFPERISTRSCEWDDRHICVTRSAFRDLEASGHLFISWQADGHGMALPASTGPALQQGRVVIFAGRHDVAETLRTRGLDIRAVEVAAGPDRFRARAATLAPSTDARGADVSLPRHDVVHHGGDLAEAVRRFHAILLEIRLQRLSSQQLQPMYDLVGNARQLMRLQRTLLPRECLRARG